MDSNLVGQTKEIAVESFLGSDLSAGGIREVAPRAVTRGNGLKPVQPNSHAGEQVNNPMFCSE